MAEYIKKPVVVEAMALPPVDDIDGRLAFDDWICKRIGGLKCRYVGSKLQIATLEGLMYADVGDFIIEGVKRELYPCKPDIFAATYELVGARR